MHRLLKALFLDSVGETSIDFFFFRCLTWFFQMSLEFTEILSHVHNNSDRQQCMFGGHKGSMIFWKYSQNSAKLLYSCFQFITAKACRLKSVIEKVHRTECRRDKVRPSSCPLPAEGRGQCSVLPTMTRGSQGAGSLANQGRPAMPCCPGFVV